MLPKDLGQQYFDGYFLVVIEKNILHFDAWNVVCQSVEKQSEFYRNK